MGIILTATAGLVLWIVLWALNVSGFDAILIAVVREAKLSDAARTAIQDGSAVAYVGETIPGTSADSLGILGDQQILQVSPTDTAVELTQASPAVPGSPGNWYENLKASGR